MDVTFRANLIQKMFINKRVRNIYKPYKVGFVELDLLNKNDLRAIENAADNWGDDSYAYNIYDSVLNYSKNSDKKHIYALVDTKREVKSLQAQEILGLAEFDEKKRGPNVLECIQVNPKYIASKNFRHIGSAMLEAIKSVHFHKPIYVFSDQDACKFYEKNDFIKSSQFQYDYYWNA